VTDKTWPDAYCALFFALCFGLARGAIGRSPLMSHTPHESERPSVAVRAGRSSARTLFHLASDVHASDAERRSHILEMLQHENLEQLVHHLVEGTMKDRELASTVLRGLTSNSDIHLAINAIRAHEAKSVTQLEKLQDGVVNAVTGICYGSMILACGELVSSLIFDTPLTLTKKALGWGFAGSAAFLAALGLLWMAAWRTHRHLERMAAELDDGVAEQLGNGTIRLLRRGFLLSLHGGLGRCQDLPDHAFLSPAEALSCYPASARGVAALAR
jgi:hypothetical protein